MSMPTVSDCTSCRIWSLQNSHDASHSRSCAEVDGEASRRTSANQIMNTNRCTRVIMDFLIHDSDKAVRFYAFCNGKSLSRLSRSGVCGTTRNPTTATPIYCIKAAIYLYSAIRPTKNRVALLPFSAFFLRQKFYPAAV